MKKSIITTLLCIFASLLFANGYEIKKVQEYNNDKNLISIRPSEKVAPQDDETGNRLFINDNGDFFIYNWDKLTTFKLADKTHLPEKEYKYDLSDLPCLYGLHRVSSDYLYYSWTYTSYLAVNIKTGKRKFQVSINDIFWDDFVYYDESTDILFFRDSNKAMHSIVHPGMNDEENRKNYKNPDQTLGMFGTEVTINGTTIRVTKSGSLFVNGNYTYWGQLDVGNYVYQNNHNNFLVYEKVNPRNNFHINISDDVEEIESAAVHPNGDIYILRMNWQTNKHTLYCIENTWDPQWREQWNKEHINSNNQNSVPQTNVAVSKVMTCNDNLRLRSQEATSSSVITTMKKGTKVKILKLGKAETIDGINSNWVQVEVLSGAKDKDGKEIKSGTTGWCYGGYLE